MTIQGDIILPTEFLEQMYGCRFDKLPELIRVVFDTVTHADRQQYLGDTLY